MNYLALQYFFFLIKKKIILGNNYEVVLLGVPCVYICILLLISFVGEYNQEN